MLKGKRFKVITQTIFISGVSILAFIGGTFYASRPEFKAEHNVWAVNEEDVDEEFAGNEEMARRELKRLQKELLRQSVRITALEQEKQELVAGSEAELGKLVGLMEQVNYLETTLEEVGLEYEQYTARLDQELGASEAEIAKLKADSQEAEQRVQSLMEEMGQVGVEIAEASSIADQMKEMTFALSDNAELITGLQERLAALEVIEKECIEERQKRVELEMEVEQQEALIASMFGETNALKEELAEVMRVQELYKMAEERIAALTENLEQNRVTMEATSQNLAELAILKDKYDICQESLTTLRIEKMGLEHELAALAPVVEQVETIEMRNKELMIALEENAELVGALQKDHEELLALRPKAQEAEECLTALTAALEKNCAEMAAIEDNLIQLADLGERYERSELEKTALQQEIVALAATAELARQNATELDNIRKQYAMAEEELASLQMEKMGLQEKIASLDQEAMKSSALAAALEEKTAALEQNKIAMGAMEENLMQLSGVRQQYEMSQEDLATLRMEKMGLEEQLALLSDVAAKARTLEEQNSKYALSLEDNAETIASLTQKRQELEESLALAASYHAQELLAQNVRFDERLKEALRLEKTVADQEEQIAEMRVAYANLSDEHVLKGGELAYLEEEKAELARLLERTEDKLTKVTMNSDQTFYELQRAEKARVAMLNELEESRQELLATKNRLKGMQSDYERLAVTAEEVSDMKQVTLAQVEEIRELQLALKAKEVQTEELAFAKSELEAELASAMSASQAMHEMKQKQEEEAKVWVRSLKQKEEECNTLLTQLETVKEQEQRILASLQDKEIAVEKLTYEFTTVRSEKENMMEQMAALQAKIARDASEMASLNTRYEEERSLRLGREKLLMKAKKVIKQLNQKSEAE